MQYGRIIAVGTAFLAGTLSGISKQLEAPGLVALFERGGIPAELLSLVGAAEFVLALALLFMRMRKAASVLMALLFAGCATLLWPPGPSLVLWFYVAMVPVVLAAGFWRRSGERKRQPYLGAIPLEISKPRQ